VRKSTFCALFVLVLVAAGTACGGSSGGGQSSSSDSGGPDACASCTASPDGSAADANIDADADAGGGVDATLGTPDGGGETGAPDAADAASDPNACTTAAASASSVGCDFYSTNLEDFNIAGQCLAAYVVNTSSVPVHITVQYPGATLSVADFTRIPTGQGTTLAYGAYDTTAGLAAGQAAVLFLAGSSADGGTEGSVTCPEPSAVPSGSSISGTGTGSSFHITTDHPVTAYEMKPYGAISQITGSSLLLPTTVWDTNYVLATAELYTAGLGNPSINVVAAQDDTQVTILPDVAVAGGGGLGAGVANTPYTFTLNAGQQAQLSQQADLSGSILQATHPVGVYAGNGCMQIPSGRSYCDHGEQMLLPVKATGSSYIGVMYRPRVSGDTAVWRIVGMVDGTALTYSATPTGAPLTVAKGQVVTFQSGEPFAIQSQDSAHPFLLFTEMTGGASANGYGDPETVVTVPTAQFRTNYTFMTDPTFPETDLVVVRGKDSSSAFDDVTLDCAGALTGWTAVGNYEWTRVDLVSGNFQNQGGCSNGPHTMTSAGPFGVTVWGWGSTATNLADVSYGFPAGLSLQPLNSVVVPATAQ
jgi:IgGFc binding protein